MTTPNPMTVARAAVADACRNLGWNVYTSAPEVTTLPAIITTPGDPWTTARTFSTTDVALVATAAVTQAGGNESALESLESGVWELLQCFRTLGFEVEPLVSPPRQVTYGQAETLSVDVPVRVRVDDASGEE